MENSKATVYNYLTSLLKMGKFSASVDSFSQTNIEDSIYKRLTSKKFRKFKMDEACVSRTKQAIHTRVSQNQPLKVIYPQGGYKLWRFPSSPEADWAEFFNISYLIEYLSPITRFYEPGVELVFYMHTLLMELHDNLTTEEIQQYVDSFQELINQFKKYLPENFSISILRDADIYSRKEYFQQLDTGKKQAEKEYFLLPDDKKRDLIRMANLNIKWKGKEDWTLLSNDQKQEKLLSAALYEMAATSNLKKVFEIVKSSKNVLIFTRASQDFIGVGSTKTSLAKYWVGFGVLEKNNKGDFLPRVLSPSQFEFAMKESHEEIKVNFFPKKNFSKILVFNNQFNFKKI